MKPAFAVRTATALCTVFVSHLASAQITSTIQGFVRDEQDSALPGATVTAESPALRGRVATDVSGATGRYRLPALPAGVYTLTVSLAGFATEQLTGIEVELSSVIDLDVTLKLAGIEEQITVTAEIPAVRAKESDLQTRIDTEVIDGIPLNGRQFLDLVSLVPGTAPRPPAESQGSSVTVFGERSITNSFLVDGFDNNNQFSRDFAEFFIQDTVQEFKVMLAGYQAEFGRASGAVANVITRSGTNNLDGRLFGFFRDDAFDSSNIEDQEPQELSRQEVGGTLGGPIIRDKTFFFGAFQVFREERGFLFDRSVIPPIIESGYFTPSLGAEPWDSTPLDKRTTAFAKVDHRFNSTNQVLGSFNLNRGDNKFRVPAAGQGPPGTVALPSAASDFAFDTTSANLRHTMFFSNSAFIESSVRMNRIEFGRDNEKPPAEEFISLLTHTPSLRIWQSNGSTAIVERNQDQFQWTESLSYFRDTADLGNHSFKVGVDLNRIELDHLSLPTIQLIHGNTILDVQDRYDELGYDLTMFRRGNEFLTDRRNVDVTNNNWAGFVQDSWELAPGITFNLGLRYDYASLFSDDKNNFGPRFGIAWDVGADGKTVIRSGWGRFYDQSILQAAAQTPELGGIQTGEFTIHVIPRGERSSTIRPSAPLEPSRPAPAAFWPTRSSSAISIRRDTPRVAAGSVLQDGAGLTSSMSSSGFPCRTHRVHPS